MAGKYRYAIALLAAFASFGKIQEEFYDTKYEVEIHEEYDFVIVGAGTTGSVIANRLSENPNMTILLLEAGRNGRGDVDVQIPFFFSKSFGGERDWKYRTVPQTQANSRTIFYARGKVAGGSSAINGLGYGRPHPELFQEWENAGARGWDYESVEPYFKKVERASGDNLPENMGKEGNLNITAPYVKQFYDFIVNAARNIGIGELKQTKNEGIYIEASTIYNASRQHAANSYLWPIYDERNSRLHLSFNSLVENILLDRKASGGYKVKGIRFRRNGKIHDVKARKEVILSAGATNSPQILMLSGIGPEKHLESFGIEVKVDLPGVGSYLQEHLICNNYFYGTNFPKQLTLTSKQVMKSFPNYLLSKQSELMHRPSTTVGDFLSRQNKSWNPSRPAIQLFFSPMQRKLKPSSWRESNDKEIDANAKRNVIKSQFNIGNLLLQPKCSGWVRLRSNDPQAHPVIDPNMLCHSNDFDVMIEGQRILENFEQSDVFKKYEVKSTVYKNCQQHNHTIPRSDEYYRCLIKATSFFCGHASGTTKMGRKGDPMAVVDSQLRVFGVDRLRVADSSISPYIPAVGTQSTCYMIGEKASDMIKEDWKLT